MNKHILCSFVFLFSSLFSFSQFREKYLGTNVNDPIYGISFLSPSTGFVAFNASIGFTTDSGATYVQHTINTANTDYNGYSVNITFGFDIRGVKAFSKDSLLVYGNYGEEPSILFSSNQGQNWKLIFHRDFNARAIIPNQGITDMTFPGNGNIGYAVQNEEVVRSTDRGQTWNTVLSLPYAALQKLSFSTVTDGFACGGIYVYKTSDGTDWSYVRVPANDGENSAMNNVAFTTPYNGYLLDNTYKTLSYTYDGGSNWFVQNNVDLIPLSGNDMYFTNDSTGFIASVLGYTVSKTTDYGKTWEPCKKANDYQYLNYGFNKLYFYNDQIGWAGGMGEYLMITTTGGSPTIPQAYFTIDTTGFYIAGTVHLNNLSKQGYTYKWYVNNNLISTAYSPSYTHDYANNIDSVVLAVSNGVDTDSLKQYFRFPYIAVPIIATVYPLTGSSGTQVTITGSNFTNATGVFFGGTPASSFQIVNDGTIDAIVANGSSGNVSVSIPQYTRNYPGFTYFVPPASNPPIITSVSPSAASAGSTVTIKGSNFNSNVQNNAVFFGSSKATIVSASATQIQCLVPAANSFSNISVLDQTTHLTGTSPKQFSLVFADSIMHTDANTFVDSYDIAMGSIRGVSVFPSFLSAADVDGDGKIDLLCSEQAFGNELVAYRNISTLDSLKFAPAQNLNTDNIFTTGDLDGDGKPDFVSPSNASYISVTRNTSTPGNISVDSTFTVTTVGETQTVAIADLDGDGRNDLEVSDFQGNIMVLRNTSSLGHISFGPVNYYKTNGNTDAVAVGDLDGDGKADMACSNFSFTSGAASVSVFKNTSVKGTISFASRIDLSVPDLQTSDIFIADFDGDGKLDIILYTLNGYSVFRNISTSGNIAFATRVDYVTGFYPQGTSLGNLRGGRNPDYVLGVFGYGYFALYNNNSTAGNINADFYSSYAGANPVGGSTYSSICADFNGDGKEDIATTLVGASSVFNFVSIFKNAIASALPVTKINFAATKQTAFNTLNWSILSNTDLNKVYIQRSADGILFDDISFVSGVRSNLNYSFNDSLPIDGNNFYRLKILDNIGKIIYSQIRVLSNGSLFQIKVFPNPATNNLLNLQISSAENTNAEIIITTLEGKAIYHNKLILWKGISNEKIDLSAFSSGTYIAKVYVDKNEATLKFVKVK